MIEGFWGNTYRLMENLLLFGKLMYASHAKPLSDEINFEGPDLVPNCDFLAEKSSGECGILFLLSNSGTEDLEVHVEGLVKNWVLGSVQKKQM